MQSPLKGELFTDQFVTYLLEKAITLKQQGIFTILSIERHVI